jgi:hypothetical protein
MRIFGPRRKDKIGGWIKLHYEAPCNLCCSPSITRLIKSRSTRCAGHAARIGGIVRKPEGRRPHRGLGVA